MRLVVIGGDAAGMSAASRVRRIDPQVAVTVLEQTRDVSYSACGMPYNIADAARPMEDLVVRAAQVFREKQGIDLRTGHAATGVDLSSRRVVGKTLQGAPFEIPYDRLLLATGASAIRPPLPGFDDPDVMVLKSLEDGRRIKGRLQDGTVRRVAIIGMGYIALEMCEALRSRGIVVTMVKPRPVFLPWLAADLAREVRATLEAQGVELHLGRPVERIEKASRGLTLIGLERRLTADLVLLAIGVRPNSGLARDAGLELSLHDAIAVDGGLRTSAVDVYAAGDCADARHVVTGERTWIPLALRANRAGWAAADNICGQDVRLPGIVGTAAFRVFDLEVARTGLTSEAALAAGFEPVEVVIKTRSRAHAHPGAVPLWVQMVGDKRSGRLLGAQIVGREGAAHRINAAAVALHAHLTVEQFGQSDLAYAPPFGPVWDPLLTAANQLLKRL